MTEVPFSMLAAVATAGLMAAGCGPTPDKADDPAPAQAGATTGADAGTAAAARLGIDIPDPLGKRGTDTPSAQASPPNEAAIARQIMADPASYKPENYVYVTKVLWERGDRQQAAFWHFLFQIRTAPWLPYNPDLGPFRSGVNASIGARINEWLGSDYDAWLETTRRAMSYERRIPLSPERPAGLSQAEWSAAVERARAGWAADFREITGPTGPTKAALEAQRRSNGRYVGPLQDPGAPLPADWR
ncbi:hypothetical protein [Brevundimonas sp.]|uniref:hypothetical protein n=1 Tax=Brevundimonas sp. TaxID=1871086 RepID=UPI003D0DB8EF